MREHELPFANKYIDLHFHLDGSVTVDIAKGLANLQGIELPEDGELEKLLSVPHDCRSLNDFLACFDLPLSLLQTREALSECVYREGEMIWSQGVVYAEIRFAPQLHMQRGMTQEDAILAALDGLKRTKLKANLILCCMRGDGNDSENFETVELAKKYLTEDGGVTAVDLAGAEAIYPTSKYGELFKKVREYGIPFTIHAGEAAGAESVRAALEYGATRIGHGVRICEASQLMAMVMDKGITLEMCPTSNRITHAVEDMSNYPLVDFLNRGIKVTVNTDDMAICRTTLADEFRYVEKAFSITAHQEQIILENAVSAAFTSMQTKKLLRKELGLSE